MQPGLDALLHQSPDCQASNAATHGKANHLNQPSNHLHPPGKSGFVPSSSANMQPTAHTSIAFVYSWQDSMISGALQQQAVKLGLIQTRTSTRER